VNSKERYRELLVGPIERFDQRNDMFRRSWYDPEWIERARSFYGPAQVRDRAGYTQAVYALRNAAWYVEDFFAMGNLGADHRGLYAWEGLDPEGISMPPGLRVDTSDPVELSRKVKNAACFFGASLVGICELDRRWLYSHVSNDITGEHVVLEIPEEYRYAIAMAIEMDYSFVQTSPTGGASAATGLGYSKMAFVAGLLAQFIRGLGYRAIPCGNDTALPDEPRFFGVREFCRRCMKCAEHCPARAISTGEETTEVPTVSNNPGVRKWPINPERCFKFWVANRTDCANCIRVCPFNQGAGWHHDLVRAAVKNTPGLNPLFLWLHGVFGYGRQSAPAAIWGDLALSVGDLPESSEGAQMCADSVSRESS